MTIRQIAETAGCGINTVRRISKTMYPMVKQEKKGCPIEYTKEQVLSIMDKLPKKNYIGDPTQMGTPNPTQMGTPGFDMKMFADMMAVSLATALKPIYDRLDSVENKPILQIEHVPEKSSRAIFREEVNKLVKLSKSDWKAVYNAVYAEMDYVYGVRVKARATNREVRPMDVLESDGLMGKAIAITREMINRFNK